MRKKILIIIGSIIISCAMAVGVWAYVRAESGYAVDIYRFSTRYMGLVPERQIVPYADVEVMIQTVIRKLYESPRSGNLHQTIPADLFIYEVIITGGIANFFFPASYHNMAPYDEALFRASLVRTMLRLPFINIEGVRILVAGEELLGPFGEPLGVQTESRVVISPDIRPWMETTQTFILYFVSEDVDGLLREQRTLQSSPFDIERTIIEELIAGPLLEGRKASIPSETQIIDIIVEGGICSINFSAEFIDGFGGHQTWAELTLKSIVNSIMENNNNVTSIQFLIESERRSEFNGVPYFDTLFERDAQS